MEDTWTMNHVISCENKMDYNPWKTMDLASEEMDLRMFGLTMQHFMGFYEANWG